MMYDGKIWDRYSIYPKKKGKKHSRSKNTGFLQKSFGWLSWKKEEVGGFLFLAPFAKA